MSFTAPLKQVFGRGAAANGVEPWWMQRVSAAALVVLGLWFAVAMALLPDFSFSTIVGWIQHPTTTVLLWLLLVVASYHSHIGVRVVLEDYVHGMGAKIVALVLSRFLHFVVAIVGIYAVARIAFGPTV